MYDVNGSVSALTGLYQSGILVVLVYFSVIYFFKFCLYVVFSVGWLYIFGEKDWC